MTVTFYWRSPLSDCNNNNNQIIIIIIIIIGNTCKGLGRCKTTYPLAPKLHQTTVIRHPFTVIYVRHVWLPVAFYRPELFCICTLSGFQLCHTPYPLTLSAGFSASGIRGHLSSQVSQSHGASPARLSNSQLRLGKVR
jgi:hypothetical protein